MFIQFLIYGTKIFEKGNICNWSITSIEISNRASLNNLWFYFTHFQFSNLWKLMPRIYRNRLLLWIIINYFGLALHNSLFLCNFARRIKLFHLENCVKLDKCFIWIYRSSKILNLLYSTPCIWISSARMLNFLISKI